MSPEKLHGGWFDQAAQGLRQGRMASDQASRENPERSAAKTGARRTATVSRFADDETPIPRDQALAAYEASGYDLATHPAHMIRRAHQRATFYFQQVMNGLDLTPTQQAALATLLKHGELSQNYLGRLTAMDPSTISIVVRKLLKNGHIKRRGSKKDQRLAMIRLTDRGTRFAIGRLADSMEVARRVLAPLSPPEQKTLMNLLHRIGDGDDNFA